MTMQKGNWGNDVVFGEMVPDPLVPDMLVVTTQARWAVDVTGETFDGVIGDNGVLHFD